MSLLLSLSGILEKDKTSALCRSRKEGNEKGWDGRGVLRWYVGNYAVVLKWCFTAVMVHYIQAPRQTGPTEHRSTPTRQWGNWVFATCLLPCAGKRSASCHRPSVVPAHYYSLFLSRSLFLVLSLSLTHIQSWPLTNPS